MPKTTFTKLYGPSPVQDLYDRWKQRGIGQDRQAFLAEFATLPALNHWLQSFDLTGLDYELLLEGFTHGSFAHETDGWPSNERLEFLGDACLQLVTSLELFYLYPEAPEGVLSKRRGTLVNREVLAALALEMELAPFLLLGRGEASLGGREKATVLADGLEAFLSVIYLSRGLEVCQNFFLKLTQISSLRYWGEERLETFDFKSHLQEKILGLYKELPEYQAREIDQGFEVELRVKGKLLAKLAGPSKKQLMKDCAEKVLKEETYLDL